MGFGWFVFWAVVVLGNFVVHHSEEDYRKARRWRYIGTFMFFAPLVYCWFNY